MIVRLAPRDPVHGGEVEHAVLEQVAEPGRPVGQEGQSELAVPWAPSASLPARPSAEQVVGAEPHGAADARSEPGA